MKFDLAGHLLAEAGASSKSRPPVSADHADSGPNITVESRRLSSKYDVDAPY